MDQRSDAGIFAYNSDADRHCIYRRTTGSAVPSCLLVRYSKNVYSLILSIFIRLWTQANAVAVPMKKIIAAVA
jgi:hypothetical protein